MTKPSTDRVKRTRRKKQIYAQAVKTCGYQLVTIPVSAATAARLLALSETGLYKGITDVIEIAVGVFAEQSGINVPASNQTNVEYIDSLANLWMEREACIQAFQAAQTDIAQKIQSEKLELIQSQIKDILKAIDKPDTDALGMVQAIEDRTISKLESLKAGASPAVQKTMDELINVFTTGKPE